MTLVPQAGPPPRTGSSGSDEVPPEILAQIIAERELQHKKLKWAAWAEMEYHRCRNARLPFERQWYINMAFAAGKQYVAPIDVPGHGFRLTVPKAPPHRVRAVVNKIRTAIRTECSKLTTSKPIPTVVPSSNETEDYSAAQVAEQLIKTEFATSEFESEYRTWIWWGVVCGVSFMKQYWDGEEPDYNNMELPARPTLPNGQEIPDALVQHISGLREQLDTPRPAKGRVMRNNVNPFFIYVPDILTERLDSQPYLIEIKTRTPLWVEKRFGFKPNCDSRATNTMLDAATVIQKGGEEHLDAVRVMEMWIKPGGHEDFPEGGLLTIINSEVVQHVPSWPLPYPEYPYYKYNGIPTGGFYSESMVTDLVPLQKEYNKTRSQAIEIKNLMAKPKLMYQEGSLNPRKINTETGQLIPYKAGYNPPQELRGSEVPQSYIQELETLRTEMDDISGQHEISRGQTTISTLNSGTAIAYLQEQDDAKLNYQVASIELAMELQGRHYLSIVGQYWNEDRIVKITGKDQTFETIHWKKNHLKGNTDVRIQTGSALPYSKAAKQALVTEFMNAGYLTPETGLELLNMGGVEKAVDEMLVDKRQAMRENLKMAEAPAAMLHALLNPAPGPMGEPPSEIGDPRDPSGQRMQQFNGDGTPFQKKPPIPVNSWDNHEEHIRWHNNYRKTQEFELLPQINKEAFELHVQMHQMALQAQLFSAMGHQVGGPPQQQEFNGPPSEDGEGGGPPDTGSEQSQNGPPQ